MKTDKILTDPKHWYGWFISTIVISVFLYFVMGINIFDELYYFPALLLIIAGVDYIKHKIKLQ